MFEALFGEGKKSGISEGIDMRRKKTKAATKDFEKVFGILIITAAESGMAKTTEGSKYLAIR